MILSFFPHVHKAKAGGRVLIKLRAQPLRQWHHGGLLESEEGPGAPVGAWPMASSPQDQHWGSQVPQAVACCSGDIPVSSPAHAQAVHRLTQPDAEGVSLWRHHSGSVLSPATHPSSCVHDSSWALGTISVPGTAVPDPGALEKSPGCPPRCPCHLFVPLDLPPTSGIPAAATRTFSQAALLETYPHVHLCSLKLLLTPQWLPVSAGAQPRLRPLSLACLSPSWSPSPRGRSLIVDWPLPTFVPLFCLRLSVSGSTGPSSRLLPLVSAFTLTDISSPPCRSLPSLTQPL